MTTAGQPTGKSTGMPPSTIHPPIMPRSIRKLLNRHRRLHPNTRPIQAINQAKNKQERQNKRRGRHQ